MEKTTFSLSVSAALAALFAVSRVKAQKVSSAISTRRCLHLFAVCGAIVALAAPRAAKAQSQSPLGLSVTNGVLMKDGQPYHGIGVNYFDAFYRNITNSSDTSYVQGFDTLQQHDIPFARFSLTGYWPSHFALYNTNKPEFYRRLDAFVDQAAMHNVGLIPSFFWSTFMVPDIVGEPVSAWGNSDSRTRQFMRSFTAEVVDRYKDSPSIFGWEFGNEFNLGSDLPNAADFRPPVQPTLGTPTSRSASDDLRGDMIHSALVDFATVVQQHDPGRVISSGNSFMRESAWNQYTSLSWTTDTPEQSAMMYDLFNPDPMNLVSGHAYDTTGWDTLLQYAAAQGKASFFGEFGVLGDDDAAKTAFHNMLQQIVDKHVSLAAVWNFDRHQAGDEWTISSATNGPRSWQLDEIQRFNQSVPEPVPEPFSLVLTGSVLPGAAGWTVDGDAGTIVDLGGGNFGIQQTDDNPGAGGGVHARSFDQYYHNIEDPSNTLAARFRVDSYNYGGSDFIDVLALTAGASVDSPAIGLGIRDIGGEDRWVLLRFIYEVSFPGDPAGTLLNIAPVVPGEFNKALIHIDSATDLVRFSWNGVELYNAVTPTDYGGPIGFPEFGASNSWGEGGTSTVTYDWVGYGPGYIPIPEPGTLGLAVLAGLGSLALVRCRVGQ